MANNSSLPDYHERNFEYDEPEYLEATSHSTNLKLYREFKALWAQRLFHDACDDYDWRQSEATNVHVSDYPYHPMFSEAFAIRVGGIYEDGCHLALEDVQYFLESTYGAELEKPDCDYLINIIKDKYNTAKFPLNMQQALEWLTTKKEELPIWPPKYIESKVRSRQNRIYAPSAEIITIEKEVTSKGLSINKENELQIKQKYTNPFCKLLLPCLTLSSLKELLISLELINSEDNPTSKANPSTLRAFVFALYEHKCIRQNGSAISKAFKSAYSAQISERYLQGSNGFSALKNEEQKSMFRETEDRLLVLIKRPTG